MNLTRDRIQSIGWLTVLVVCFALTIGLTLRVNAVKSQVHDAERRIVSVERDIDFLETEFQTRSSQQQLQALNQVEFGYTAPKAAQYIEGERQLAALGTLPGPGAPAPIRFANADAVTADQGPNPIMEMVSPVENAKDEAKARAGTTPAAGKLAARDPEREELVATAAGLSRRIARVNLASAGAGH